MVVNGVICSPSILTTLQLKPFPYHHFGPCTYCDVTYLFDPEGALLALQIHPGVVAVRALVEDVTMSVHDGLENGSVGSDTNSCSDHYGML